MKAKLLQPKLLPVKPEEMFVWPNKPLRVYDIQSFLSKVDPNQWVVQPKYDGHRAHPICDTKGNVVVFSRYGKPLTRAGNKWGWLSMLPIPRPWMLDCELTSKGEMYVWDIAILGGEYVYQKSYGERFSWLSLNLGTTYRHISSRLSLLESLPAKEYRSLLLRKADKTIEGVVFKNTLSQDLWGPFQTKEHPSQIKYKWSS